MKTFEKVAPLLKKSWKNIAFGILIIVLVDAAQLVIPKIVQWTIDNFGKEGYSKIDILYSSLLIIGLALSIAGFRYLWRILIIGNSWRIDRKLRQMYYDHLMKLSQNFFNKAKTGDLMAYATNDLNAVRMLMGIGFVAGADIIIMTIASFSFMTFINLELTLLAIIPLPIMTVFIIFFGKKMHKQFRKVQKSFATLSGEVQESLSGIRVVKAFNKESAEKKRIHSYADNYCVNNIKLAKLRGSFHPFLRMIIGFSIAIVLVFGGASVIHNKISVGEFIAFNSYLHMLVWPMIAIGWIVGLYQRGTASLKRLNNIFSQPPEINDSLANKSIKNIKGHIEFKDLTFKYKDDAPLIYDHVNISVERGHTLAVVGKTGSGKSTLVELLLRVYNPAPKSIFVDGYDILEIPLQTLRRSIIIVPQDIFLFSDTITNNIRLGNPNTPIERVYEVAKQAQVYTDIKEFPEGFETVIGERGVTLSGGQRQRIAIARALLCNPPILIFDDSLSAVDTETERNILEHLMTIRKNKTTIIISHRVSSIQHAEKIIVVEKGKIVQSGDHETLSKVEGPYKELANKQKIKEKLEDE